MRAAIKYLCKNCSSPQKNRNRIFDGLGNPNHLFKVIKKWPELLNSEDSLVNMHQVPYHPYQINIYIIYIRTINMVLHYRGITINCITETCRFSARMGE